MDTNSGVFNICVPIAPLPPPLNGSLSATILSSTSLSISWTPSPGVAGYIVNYNGGQPVLIEGSDSTNYVLEKLTQGTTYQIKLYTYIDLPSVTFSNLTVLFDGKL